MWGKNRKQKSARIDIDTLIGHHSEVTGDIKFRGGLHIDGTLRGNVTSETDERSRLSLSEHGTIEGEVKVPFVVIDGVVIGDVHGSEHVELASKARVAGNVYYNLIEMAIGAEVNGKLVHYPAGEEAPLALQHDNSQEST